MTIFITLVFLLSQIDSILLPFSIVFAKAVGNHTLNLNYLIMTHQLTILDSDNSFVEAFLISNSLYLELMRISQILELERLNLAFLLQIQVKALTFCSRQLNTIEPTKAIAFASTALDWFDELITLIAAVEKLQSPHSLSIILG